jgi:hypothetical protein
VEGDGAALRAPVSRVVDARCAGRKEVSHATGLMQL